MQLYSPTHTLFAHPYLRTAPQLDVLLVPGGIGSMDPLPGGGKPDIDRHIEFIRNTFRGLNGRTSLKYLISMCNATILVTRAGLLDGQTATTNQDGWKSITAMGPKTHWIAKTRWADSGRMWTTSGVSAGADDVLAWIESLIPQETLTHVVDTMKWIRAESADNDPFAEVFGCEGVPRLQD
jgi:transcriptional regulator GlxA family with amidase domain